MSEYGVCSVSCVRCECRSVGVSALKATTKFGTCNVYSYSVEKNLISFRRDNVRVGTEHVCYMTVLYDCYMYIVSL